MIGRRQLGVLAGGVAGATLPVASHGRTLHLKTAAVGVKLEDIRDRLAEAEREIEIAKMISHPDARYAEIIREVIMVDDRPMQYATVRVTFADGRRWTPAPPTDQSGMDGRPWGSTRTR